MKKIYSSYGNVLAALVIIIALNIISSFYFFRIDLTFDRRFSLSPLTKEKIKAIDDMVYVKVYLDGDLPAGFKMLRNSTREMLDEFRAFNKNIEYEFINPSAGESKKERLKVYRQLASEGMAYYNIPVENKDGYAQKTIFPSASITYRDKTLPINLLVSNRAVPTEADINNSIQKLELNFFTILNKITEDKPRKVGFTRGHGELSDLEVADISYEIGKSYEVSRVMINGKVSALNHRVAMDSIHTVLENNFDLIIIAKPDSAFNERDKFIIDQYVMHGGKVIWLVDGVKASMDSLYHRTVTMGIDPQLNIDDMLFKYGVRIRHNLVLNRNALEIGTAEGTLRRWDYFPLALVNKKHPINTNIETLKTQFVSSLDTIPKKSLKKTILLHTDNDSRLAPSPVIIDVMDIIYRRPNLALYRYPPQAIGALVEGRFTSIYKNRPIDPRIANNPDFDVRYQSPPTAMAFFSDGDLIRNQFVNQSNGTMPLPLGYDRYTRKMFDNKNFFLNTVNYMLGDINLIKLRSKELKIRLLDKKKMNNKRLFWQLLNTVLPLVLILLTGLTFMLIKRYKYLRK